MTTVEVDEKSLRRLVAALRTEATGQALRRDLTRDFAIAAEPAREAVRAAILSMPSPAEITRGPGLRSAVASKVVIKVKLGGRSPGAAIIAKKSGMPRGFAMAPKRLNSRRGWRHQVFGTNEIVHQEGLPGWFDDTLPRFRANFHRAAKKAMDAMADRVADRTRG